MQTDSKVTEKLHTETVFHSSANWFFWIAGLSLVNSIIHLTGSDMSFVIGLGAVQVVDVVARQMGTSGQLLGFGVAVAIAGVFVGFGALCRGRRAFAFYVGAALYAVDGLLFLIVGDWLSLGFHAFALVMIIRGPSALGRLQALELAAARAATVAAGSPAAPAAPSDPRFAAPEDKPADLVGASR